jgi:hypothetical protein
LHQPERWEKRAEGEMKGKKVGLYRREREEEREGDGKQDRGKNPNRKDENRTLKSKERGCRDDKECTMLMSRTV